MKISHVKISNILGIDDLDFTPGGFTTIEGPNGTGKTSVLEAIKAAVQTGHDATLLRRGAEKGEVVLVLDDGQSIAKRVTADGSKTEVRDAEGKKLGRPAEAIAKLTDMLSVNPVDFLMAPKKDRVRVLLESMPIEVDAAELTRISGIKVTATPGLHALHVIDQVAKQVYDERTGTNRAVKEKDATINQLRAAMPDAIDGAQGDEQDLVDKVEEARTSKDTEVARIDTKLAGLRDEARGKIDAIRADLQAKIDALKAEAQQKVDEINTGLSETERKATTQREKTIAKYNDTVGPLNSALAVIRTNREAAAKRAVTLETIGKLVEELEGLRADAAKQTKALDDIEAYKSKLLANLPIPGLEVKDGEVYRGGVPLDRLNTAQQVEIAVGVAKLRAGQLGVVCVDRIECLDAENFAAFREQMADSGLQLFVTKVGEEEFAINTAGD